MKIKDEKYGYSNFLLKIVGKPKNSGEKFDEHFWIGVGVLFFIYIILLFFSSKLDLFYYGIEILNFTVFVYAIKIFQHILYTVINNSAFILKNALRLKKLGFIFIIAEVFNIIMRYVGIYLFDKVEEIPRLIGTLHILDNGKGLLIGFIFLFMSEVFGTGCRLKEESDLTI